MPTILITGPERSGKTSLAAGLLALARGTGRSPAYCKPFSASAGDDADHAFVSGVMATGTGVSVGPAPLPASDDLEDAVAALTELQDQAGLVIAEIADGAPGVELADETGGVVLEVQAYAPGRDWAAAVDEAAGRWGNRLASLVINAVPPYRRDEVTAGAAESSAEVDTVVVPESRIMLAPTVGQVAEHLDAVWTLEPVNTDAPVERFLIGGNIMDNGPTYYGRYANQAVITRVQRPDIQLASMMPETRCLVLTGPGEPTEYIKAEAMERDIPLLQVFASTIETADALDHLIDAVRPYSMAKVRHYAALLEQHAGREMLGGWLS